MSPSPGDGRGSTSSRERCSIGSSRCCGASRKVSGSGLAMANLSVRQAPQESEQAIELDARLRRREDPAPGLGEIERGEDLVSLAVGDLVGAALVAARAALAFAEVVDDA